MAREITINVYHHADPQMGYVIRLLEAILRKEIKMATNIDELITDAQDESTVDDSVIALLNNISAQLAAAGTDQAKLDQLKTLIDGNKSKIAAAVVANTPAAPVA